MNFLYVNLTDTPKTCTSQLVMLIIKVFADETDYSWWLF